MQEAFALGAAVVELDLHTSADGVLVVFHDATLDCRTDGHGPPETRTLAELRALDVGWGYTADDGRTFPLRGTGVGLLPTLEEVLSAFPDRTLLRHLKTDRPEDGDRLADLLSTRPPPELPLRLVYGGGRAVARVVERLPQVQSIEKSRIKACAMRYLAVGWTGWIPSDCRDTVMALPVDGARWMWGWPRRFDARMASVGTRVILVGPLLSEWTSGIDTVELANRVPDDFDGWVWTNRIENFARG